MVNAKVGPLVADLEFLTNTEWSPNATSTQLLLPLTSLFFQCRPTDTPLLIKLQTDRTAGNLSR